MLGLLATWPQANVSPRRAKGHLGSLAYNAYFSPPLGGVDLWPFEVGGGAKMLRQVGVAKTAVEAVSSD